MNLCPNIWGFSMEIKVRMLAYSVGVAFAYLLSVSDLKKSILDM